MADIDNKQLEARKVKRMRYTDGLFLRQEEFNLEQSYHIRMRRLHNRHLHSPGIVYGLEVTIGDQGVYVGPGMALFIVNDPERNEEVCQEIVITENTKIDFSRTLISTDSGEVYIYLSFTTERKDIVDDRGGKEEIHWWERPVLEPEKVGVKDPDRLILAKLKVIKNVDGSITAVPNSIDVSDRQYAGVTGRVNIPVAGNETSGLSIEGRRVGDHNGIQVKAPVTKFDGNIIAAGKVSFQSTDAVVRPIIAGKLIEGKNGIEIDSPITSLSGDSSINGNCVIKGDCTITGNLNVTGDRTIINTTELEIEDNIIRVNKNVTEAKLPVLSGLEVYRGIGTDSAMIVWNNTDNRWKIGLGNQLEDVAYGANWTNLTNQSVVDLHRHSLLAKPDGSRALSVDEDGNIGIGVDTPGVKLLVNGKIAATELNITGINGSGALTTDALTVRTSTITKTLSVGETATAAALTITGATTTNTLSVAGAATAGTLTVTGTVTASRFFGDGSSLSNISPSQWLDTDGGIFYKKGNVGIGPAFNPLASLTINDNIRDFYPEDTPGIMIGNNEGNTAIWQGWDKYNFIEVGWSNGTDTDSIPHGRINTSDDTPLVLQERGGNVGIGVSKPDYNLEVRGSVKADTLNVTNMATAATLNVSGGTTTHTLSVTNMATVARLNVNGTTTTINLGVTGNTTLAAVNVSGTTTTNSLSVTGTATAGTLNVTNTVTAGRFVGDGSGLNNINIGGASQWVDTDGGIFYEKGNVGIGPVSSPLARLTINDNVVKVNPESTPGIMIGNMEGNTAIWQGRDISNFIEVGWSNGADTESNPYGRIYTSENTSLVLQEWGANVGIGVRNPEYNLDVAGSVKADYLLCTGSLDVNSSIRAGSLNINTSITAASLNIGGAITANSFSGNGIVPIGAVFYFARSTAPSGYLECTGAAVSRTAYAALFAVIGTTFGAGDGATTFNLPDLRGEFIRGWDHGRSADWNRVFGSAQAEAVKAPAGYGFVRKSNSGEVVTATTLDSSGSGTEPDVKTAPYAGAAETRPRNIALLPCIKY